MIYDLIIIGGGPAGITAGIYAARKKLKTLLLVRDFVGQIGKISSIENWPGEESITGMNLMQKLKNHLKKFELEVKDGEDVNELKKENNIFEIKTKKGDLFSAKTVIVTSGRTQRPLGVPGEAEFVGKGVSSCSTCDAPFFKDKIVAVVGGGNAGFRTALDLIPYASKIYVLDAVSILRADEVFQEKLKNSGKAEIILNAKVLEIKGKAMVESLQYQDIISGEIKEMPINGIFIEVGSIPATAFLGDLVDFTQTGDVIIDPKTCATKVAGLYAAGDVTDVAYKQLIISAGEGAKAALSACNFLQGKKAI